VKRSENGQHFASANQNAKLVRAIVTLVRRARLDYEGFRRVCAQVRRELEIRRPRRSRRLPHILSDADLKKFYESIDQAGNRPRLRVLTCLLGSALGMLSAPGANFPLGILDLYSNEVCCHHILSA
jgi:hypothetical protein